MKNIALIALEPSADVLGAEILAVLQKKLPHFSFWGIGGHNMRNLGLHSIANMEDFAVMGIWEIIKYIPRFIAFRWKLLNSISKNKPDLVICIDSPDFNLALARKVKHKLKIRTWHVVCPSIWAWRSRRIKKIINNVDKLFCLFPFEKDFCLQHGVDACFIGHPLASKLNFTLPEEQFSCRKKLFLPTEAKILCLLPGSREFEINNLLFDFLLSAYLCAKKQSIVCVVGLLNNNFKQKFNAIYEKFIQKYGKLDIRIFINDTHNLIRASDIVLCASGTVTLEVMLLGKPMIVAYRLSKLTFLIIQKMVKIKFCSLPNILANRQLIKEFVQNDISPECIAKEISIYLNNKHKYTHLQNSLHDIALTLKANLSKILVAELNNL